MKNFFKTFGAALLAFFVGTVLMWFVLFSIIGGIAASFGQRQVYVPSDAVLVVDFRSGIVDSPDNRFGAFDVNRRRLETSNTMLEVTDAVRLAASDPNIKGIYINIAGSGAVNYGNMEELRSELLRFKESGKFVVAYNEVYSQPAYWLSSAADRVFIHPEGFMDWRGVAANVMFYKGLLDKLGVDVEIIRHGTFKSAVEPYITDRMSPANRLQMTTLVNSLWDVMLADISESRGIPADKLRQYAEEMAVREPDDALRFGFVDGVLYRDEMAVHLIDQIDYDFSQVEKKSHGLMQRFGSLEVAMRQNDLAWEVQNYLADHPDAAVVNLGCGLDGTGRACDNGSCKIYNLDFPDVIAVRNQLLPAGDREENIPCNLNDTEWFTKIDPSERAIFFASGVFYYFLTEQVRTLVQAMADSFPGGVLVFDAANRTAVKMIAKTWLKSAKIQDVGAYFAVSDAKSELSTWDSRLQVTSRGYMLGYNDLRDPSVSGLFRFLARTGDRIMKMQIVRICFGQR